MAEVEIPTKKNDGGGDGSRPKERTAKKKAPKEKAAGRSGSESAAKYVIPKIIRTPDKETAARGDARNVSTRGGRGSRRGACFICTVEGHYARDCPKSGYATVRGRGRGRGRGAPRIREKEL